MSSDPLDPTTQAAALVADIRKRKVEKSRLLIHRLRHRRATRFHRSSSPPVTLCTRWLRLKPSRVSVNHWQRRRVNCGLAEDHKRKNIEGLPTQDNGNDCGIFVMKYMEASLGKDQVDGRDIVAGRRKCRESELKLLQHYSKHSKPLC
ncbi:hypothetical protein KSP40_PGU021288 [Platanthera guangdongensis]|uniref:Ubiquitin-like protease family profile domain-containing protein n=1 Tax=Platanthera guangdongensis TaxID=2320717 RepID=A0ABR2N119_9ASPA